MGFIANFKAKRAAKRAKAAYELVLWAGNGTFVEGSV
jgi:hypothetical protein